MHWILQLKGGLQRVNHAAVAIDDKIYSFGGYCTDDSGNMPVNIDIYVFHTETLKWKRIKPRFGISPTTPCMVFGHTVVAYKNKAYLFGGRGNGSAYNSLHCFDVDLLEWSQVVTHGINPPLLDGHSACVIKNYMYVFGGYHELLEHYIYDTYRINLETFKWEKLSTKGCPPIARDFHTASVIGNNMYIFGGRSNNDPEHASGDFYEDDMTYLNTENMTWIRLVCHGDTPCGRRSHSAVVYKNEIYIFGGYSSSFHVHLNDLIKFNPETCTWTRINANFESPQERRRHSACVVNNTMYMFGGSRPSQLENFGSPTNTQLVELSDMCLLDFFPSLKRLSEVAVIRYRLNPLPLPRILQEDIKAMSSHCCMAS